MKKLEVSEWMTETNQWGGVKRYRFENGVKTYETIVTTADGVAIPQSQLENYNHRKIEHEVAAIAESNAAPVPTICPFNDGNRSCSRDKCALFIGDICILAQISETAAIDTFGKSCPFSPYSCRKDCSLYKNGCVLTAIKERMIKNESVQ